MKNLVILFAIAASFQAAGAKTAGINRYEYAAKAIDSTPSKVGNISVPAASGPLIIDGKPDEAFWRSAVVIPLVNPDIPGHEQGGEARSAVRGNYLCFSARVPESDRLVVRSTGINPTWEREDLLAWRFKIYSKTRKKSDFFTIAVNAFGAISVFENASHYIGSMGDDVINSVTSKAAIGGSVIQGNTILNAPIGAPLDLAKRALVAAAIDKNGWTVELALPLEQFQDDGFMWLERVRAPRPDMPELTWHWPAENVRGHYTIAGANQEPSPEYKPTDLPKNLADKAPAPLASPLAKEIADLPKWVWSESERKSLGVTSMWDNSIQSRMSAFAEKEKLDWRKVNTLKDWESFRSKRIAAFENWIGPMPERTPLKDTVTRRLNYGDGFVIENIVFESRPSFLVTANLYLPEKPSGKIPAVVLVHAHHAPKTQAELQDMGMTWARAGVAVLVMDQISGGERSQSQPRWARESYFGRYATGNQLYLAGESLIKWMAWDIMRGIDVLEKKPYIDAKRIILVGAVAGGGDPAAVTANLDPRIAAVVPFNFGDASPEAHYTELPRKYDFETADPGGGDWETSRALPNSISQQFFPWFLCAAGAPRPFIFAFELEWPKTVENESAWPRYKKVYELTGARENLGEVNGIGAFPGAGETNQVSVYLRQHVDDNLHRMLQFPIARTEYHNVRPEKELMCLTPEVARAYKPQTVVSLLKNMAVQRLEASRSARQGLDAAQRKTAIKESLKQKLGDIDPVRSPTARKLWDKQYADFTLEASTIITEPGITLPVFLLKSKTGSKQRPVVIALAEGGKENFLALRSNEISALLKKGIIVCLPDLRGNGELNDRTTRLPGIMGNSSTELMLGTSLTGLRLKDTRAIMRWLAKRSDIDSKKIALWGDSFSDPNAPDYRFDQSPGQRPGPVPQRQAEPLGPFLAMLTAFYEDGVAAVAGSGGLVSFMSALDDRFCHIPQDVIVPGILETTDLGEIAAFIAPRPLLLENMVDGLNKKVSLGAMEQEYGKSGDNLLLRESPEENLSMADWLSSRLQAK
ncbi:MAG: acetylxylan esterase [Chitinophagaceae bacterium]|nr:acetylxylan esterase [Chitinophagaceae bacterium]